MGKNANNLSKGWKMMTSKGRQAAKGVAKYLRDMKPVSEVVGKAKKGDVVGAIKSGFKHMSGMKKAVVQAYTGKDENAKAWYVVYKPVTPAANENRPMGALFNLPITDDPTMGTTCRYMEVLMRWDDFTDSYMWEQTMNASYQLIRKHLKSNLPYTQNALSAYINNAIQLAIVCKQVERDIHWYNYANEDFPEFQQMFSLRADVSEGYGIVELHQDHLLTASGWSENLASYERLIDTVPLNVKLPPNLALFIAHYFGTVFVDGADSYNDQSIINRMTNFVWKEYDFKTDETTTEELDATQLTIDDITTYVTKLGKKFGMLISDLVKSGQYVPLYMDAFDNYDYQFVYDKTFLQAIENAYTDDSAVLPNNYIRLDRYADVEDNLTQYIFAGGYAPREKQGLANVPAIRVLAEVLKYDSNEALEWPINIDQVSFSGETMNMKQPFGIKVQTSISMDDYIKVSVVKGAIQYPYDGALIDIKGVSQTVDYNQDSNTEIVKFGGAFGEGANDKKYFVFEKLGLIELSTTEYIFGNVIMINPIANTTMILDSKVFCMTVADYQALFVNNEFTTLGGSESPFMNSVYFASMPPKAGTADQIELYISDFAASNVAENTSLALADGSIIQSVYMYRRNYVSSTFGGVTVGSSNRSIYISFDWSKTVQTSVYEITDDLYFSSVMSVTAVEIGDYTSDEDNTAISMVSGFAGLVPMFSKETHAGIPVVYRSNLHATVVTGDANKELSISSAPILVKDEHIPYFYNILDLQAVLYTMFVSLFTPSVNIYQMLLSAKKSYDDFVKRSRKKNKSEDEGKEDKEDNK